MTVLEPADKARPKIGVKGKWIHVSDPKGLQGYVAADFVELEVETDNEAEPTPATLIVYVSNAAAAGLRMRGEPNTNSSTLMILPAGSELQVVDGTAKMIGVFGKWLKVREVSGTEGFVAAWYVRK